MGHEGPVASGTRPLPNATSEATTRTRRGTPARRNWARLAAMLPAVGATLLPKVACPACWPAYAGLLTALGLGFLLESAVLLPLTVGFLAAALFSLGFRARRRRGYRPLVLGLLASAFIVVGKFAFDSNAVMYVGVAALVAASFWNGWPRKASRSYRRL